MQIQKVAINSIPATFEIITPPESWSEKPAAKNDNKLGFWFIFYQKAKSLINFRKPVRAID